LLLSPSETRIRDLRRLASCRFIGSKTALENSFAAVGLGDMESLLPPRRSVNRYRQLDRKCDRNAPFSCIPSDMAPAMTMSGARSIFVLAACPHAAKPVKPAGRVASLDLSVKIPT
jgi:hypothetical protein